MRYYAQYKDNNLTAIGTGYGGVEITEEEYNHLLSEIRTKAAFVDSLYNGEITISDVPTEWQEEIQRRVNERIAAEGEAENQDISAEEALEIILGGEV
jgi:abortive infection bacteriophage resistance protein